MIRPWAKLPTPWYRRIYHDALAIASPRRAVVAWHFDRMDRDPDYRDAVHMGMRALGYATQPGPNKAAWPTNGNPRSADAEVLHDLEKLRERVRILGRIDPVGSGVIRKFTIEIVGCGIHDRANTGDPAKDVVINEVWGELQKSLAPAELGDTQGAEGWFVVQYILAERLVEDGEVWERAVKRAAAAPLEFELVEGDRVDTPMDVLRVLPKHWQVRDGIERDEFDRIKAYWIAKWHPGDTAIPKMITDRLPFIPLTMKDYDRCTPEQAKHVRLPGRPGQSRPVPLLHAVIQDLRDMDLTIEAGVKRIQVASSFAVFIETAADIPDLVDATARKYHYQLNQDLVPGMVFVLRPGEKASTINPNFPTPDLKVLQEILARRIGAALNISWRVVLSDVADASFSGARADRIEFEESAAVPRMVFVGGLDWMRRLALEDALLRGEERLVAAGVTVEDCGKTNWLRREKKWLDPKNEAEGAKAALEGKLLSQKDYFSAHGKDWQEEKRQQLLEEEFDRDARAELGLGGDSSDRVGPQWVAVLQDVIAAVSAGTLPPESAIALIQVAYPKVTKEQAEALINPAAQLAAKKKAKAEQEGEEDTSEGDDANEDDQVPPEAKPRRLNGKNGVLHAAHHA